MKTILTITTSILIGLIIRETNCSALSILLLLVWVFEGLIETPKVKTPNHPIVKNTKQ